MPSLKVGDKVQIDLQNAKRFDNCRLPSSMHAYNNQKRIIIKILEPSRKYPRYKLEGIDTYVWVSPWLTLCKPTINQMDL